MCPQPNPNESDISEDCLRLNVYTVSILSHKQHFDMTFVTKHICF